MSKKVRAFIKEYEDKRNQYGGEEVDDAELGTVIKWTRDLKRQLRANSRNKYSRSYIRHTLFRPFVKKFLYFNQPLNEMQYQIPLVFPTGKDVQNKVMCFSGIASSKPFSVLATNEVYGHDTLEKTQCLPLYRYNEDGERVCNITEYGIRQFNDHYRQEWGDDFGELAGPEGITAEDIFAYTYAVLHDPVYRRDYRVDLLREFPRLPFYHDFPAWKRMGQELLDLHVNFEQAEPFPLRRVDEPPPPRKRRQRTTYDVPKVSLQAGKQSGTIYVDDETTLYGVPPEAWEYQLGSRSALEWILDQYKERKPRDPTIAERFNTYRFADYKEQVIDLLMRVCTVSVKTVEIVNGMAYWNEEGNLVVYGDRDKHEWETLGLSQWFGEPGGPDDDPEYQAWLKSQPDIRNTGQ